MFDNLTEKQRNIMESEVDKNKEKFKEFKDAIVINGKEVVLNQN